MLPGMLEAAAMLNQSYGCRSVVAGLRGVYDYESACGPFRQNNVTVTYDDPRRTIFESDLVLTASGTATLETGIIGRPMVVVYRTGMLTYMIARQLVKLDRIALVNLVLGDCVVPELIQGRATPTNMAAALDRFWPDEDYRVKVQTELQRVPTLLGGIGASERAAEAMAEYL